MVQGPFPMLATFNILLNFSLVPSVVMDLADSYIPPLSSMVLDSQFFCDRCILTQETMEERGGI